MSDETIHIEQLRISARIGVPDSGEGGAAATCSEYYVVAESVLA